MSSTCVAAIVVLRVIRSVLWSSDTLSDILALGSKIYKENLKSKSKGQNEIRVADITSKIQFRSFECLIESQQMFFGKVESTVANICNIEQGLVQFFMSHIAGVIDGPNVVAVWKENNHYYMYDAKARNGFGLKLTKEENAEGEDGSSCVTRFQHLKDLAEIYVENVPRKERQDYYKITHIELKPFLGKNWHQWIVTMPGQWCLRGEVCLLKPKENLPACVSALLYAESVEIKNWSQRTIEEIVSAVSLGNDQDKFNGENDLKEMRMEIVFKDTPAFVYIKQKMFRYVVNTLDKDIEDCLVKGEQPNLFALAIEWFKRLKFLSQDLPCSLKRISKESFRSTRKNLGNIFPFGNRVPIGSHLVCIESIMKVRNLNLFPNKLHHCKLIQMEVTATDNKKKETWSALRFTSPIDMVKSLTANITIRKNQEVSLLR